MTMHGQNHIKSWNKLKVWNLKLFYLDMRSTVGAVGVWIGEKEYILDASWTLIQNYHNCTSQLYYLDPNVIPALEFWVLHVDIGKDNNHTVSVSVSVSVRVSVHCKHLLHLGTRWHPNCCHGMWNSQQGNSFCMYVWPCR